MVFSQADEMEGKGKMLRAAATLFGCAIVAFSIGFNTKRYPVVWEMTAPVRANESAHPAIASPSVESERHASPEPTAPVVHSDIKPIPDVAERAEDAQVKAPPRPTPAADTTAPTLTSETHTPLVPVTPVSLPATSADKTAWAPGVQRLPTIERSDSTRLVRAPASDGPLPRYPSTGIP